MLVFVVVSMVAVLVVVLAVVGASPTLPGQVEPHVQVAVARDLLVAHIVRCNTNI